MPMRNCPSSSSSTLVTLGVHSGHRAMSDMTAQIRSGGALISIVRSMFIGFVSTAQDRPYAG
jgi:hypothetical protein